MTTQETQILTPRLTEEETRLLAVARKLLKVDVTKLAGDSMIAEAVMMAREAVFVAPEPGYYTVQYYDRAAEMVRDGKVKLNDDGTMTAVVFRIGKTVIKPVDVICFEPYTISKEDKAILVGIPEA